MSVRGKGIIPREHRNLLVGLECISVFREVKGSQLQVSTGYNDINTLTLFATSSIQVYYSTQTFSSQAHLIASPQTPARVPRIH